jgi:hypothetical protein
MNAAAKTEMIGAVVRRGEHPKIFESLSTRGRKTIFTGQMSGDLSTMAETN